MQLRKDVVICGAGIAGVSAAYFLAAHQQVRDILIVDERAPLSLTSDKSTECYRNWWPGPGDAMVALMNRSIDLLDELADRSGNSFHMNRRGYLYLTGDPAKVAPLRTAAENTARLGAGALRIHTGQPGDPDYIPVQEHGYSQPPGLFPTGADLLLDPELIQAHFPYLSPQTVAALHVRRAGWFSAQQLGIYLLDEARATGVELVNARIDAVEVAGGRVQAVVLDNGLRVETHHFVNAAGPFFKQVSWMVELDLPVFTELHLKAAFVDSLCAVPRNAPLLIWTDPQMLPWSLEERALLSEEEETRWLLKELPGGAHTRPEGGADSRVALMLWEYHVEQLEPSWPPELDPQYPEIVLRGLATMLPALQAYFARLPRPRLDGGYYTKTAENRPLIGPTPVDGFYLIGALSGYGLMAACAAGELLAAHLVGRNLPSFAPAFRLDRYANPGYDSLLQARGESGQL